MTRDEFIVSNPILRVLQEWQVEVNPALIQQDVKCLFHKDSTASMSVNAAKGLWYCQAGCGKGSVIDLIAKKKNITPGEVLRQSGVGANGHEKTAEDAKKLDFRTVCTYDYTDELGEMRYQVVRMHADDPDGGKYHKTFRQRQPVGRGEWKWTMDGATRVLYHLQAVRKANVVWVVEGEKDADNLTQLGLSATCNVGGAGKWLDSYSDTLEGKEVILCGDNDKPGQDHIKTVFESLAGKAMAVRVVKLPTTVKDASDFIATFKDTADARRTLDAMAETASPFTKGVRLPIYQMFELEARYHRLSSNLSTMALDLGKWLPSLGHIRPIVPGEVVVFMADTGVGKTACLQNVALKADKLKTLMFELELPVELMYERFVAIKTKLTCAVVEDAYKTGDQLGRESLSRDFPNLWVCGESHLGVDDIESLINHSELKIGERPRLVLIDYIGLIKSKGGSRYERVSQIAEELKAIAKATQVVMVLATQVHRPNGENLEPSLHDAKDSGSIENSAGLVIGVWKDENDPTLMKMRVLKNTKGRPGATIECNFDGERCTITERSRISDADVPDRKSYATHPN